MIANFVDRYLFGLSMLFSVCLHGGVAAIVIVVGMLAALANEAPTPKAVQSGRASISLRSSVAAGPKPSDVKFVEKKPAEKEQLMTVPTRMDETPAKLDAKIAKTKTPADRPVDSQVVQVAKKTETSKPAEQTKPTASPMPQPPQIISDQVSLPARGSAGSRGVEVDGLPQEAPSNPAPPYPPPLLRARVEGTTKLFVKIDAAGKVKSVEVYQSSGYEEFDQSALETVRQWEFTPARRGGVPTAYEFVQPIQFLIRRR